MKRNYPNIILVNLVGLIIALFNSGTFCQTLYHTNIESLSNQQIPLEILKTIAHEHASEVWGDYIGQGRFFPVADVDGNTFAYVFPYIIGSKKHPVYDSIYQIINELQATYLIRAPSENDSGSWKISKEFLMELKSKFHLYGSIYVSSTTQNFPILKVDHFINPYFTMGEITKEIARRYLDDDKLKLTKIYYLGPHEEYFEYQSSRGNPILVHINSLKIKTLDEVLTPIESDTIPPEIKRRLENSWNDFLLYEPKGIDPKDIPYTHTTKNIPYWKLIPVINYTYWCSPTSIAMVLGFWDNYVKSTGTIKGYGRLIDYWFTHNTSGNNIPNFLDEIIDPNTRTWRRNAAGVHDLASTLYIYTSYIFYTKFWITGNASNDYAWLNIKKEIDGGRPFVWGVHRNSPNPIHHAMTAYGYRISGAQRFVRVYNPPNPATLTFSSEYNHDQWAGLPLSISDVGMIMPISPPQEDHLIINSPNGGESLNFGIPFEISWYVWGKNIKNSKISFSSDGGNNWQIIKEKISTKGQWNSFIWIPHVTTNTARIKIEGLSNQSTLLSSDGSQENFSVNPTTLHLISGEIASIDIRDLMIGYGPPSNHLDAEVFVKMESKPDLTLGFQLRYGKFLDERENWFLILKEAYSQNKLVNIEYILKGDNLGKITRVSLIK